VMRDCWLIVVLAQYERYHGRSDAQRFRFCCLMLDQQVRKRFLNNLLTRFWRKELQYIKLEGRSRRSTLSSTSPMCCAS
jgi:hypothetical protein